MVPQIYFGKEKKIINPGCIVEIDKSLFRVKRKCNRGRLRCGDRRVNKNQESEGQQNKRLKNKNQEHSYKWVFGLCSKYDNRLLERTFCVVNN